jgi:hypothetical protein
MLIIDSKKLVLVDLFYRMTPGGLRVETSTVVKNLPEDEQKEYSKLSLKLRPMNWKMYNTLQKESLIDSGSGQADTINWVLYKEKKLHAIVAEWNLTDEKGAAVPVNTDTIGALHPVIPEMILREYDAKTMSGGD